MGVCARAAAPCRFALACPRPKGSRRRDPRGSVQKRPTGVISKPANGSGSELSKVVPDRELSKQGKSGLFPQSFKKKRIQKSGAVLSRGRLWFWSWLFRRRGVGLRLGPPAPRSTFEDVTMVQEAI